MEKTDARDSAATAKTFAMRFIRTPCLDCFRMLRAPPNAGPCGAGRPLLLVPDQRMKTDRPGPRG
eukprot:45087-Eustigmatos_ZCMA.PRE.1